MALVLSEKIASILKWAMWFIVQRSTLKKADTLYKLHKLAVNKEDNLMLKANIKLTTSAKEVLKKAPTNLHQGLKNSWVIFLKKIVEKIKERSPLGYKLVRVSAALDPRNMTSLDADTLQTMFDAFVGIMHNQNKFQANKVIVVKSNMNNF